MTADVIHAKLGLLRDNLEKLAQIPQSTLDEFLGDFRNLDSALLRLQTTIQALIDVGSFVVAQQGLGAPSTSRDILALLERSGHLPEGATDRFGPLFGFRNRVVHLYDRIDPEIVFRILTEERGDLLDLAKLLTKALEGDTAG
jgi:uncharacterized protein YutE (UPF0331/DUF86 family)